MGSDLIIPPQPLPWLFEAVVYDAKVDPQCLAITGKGKPCTNGTYGGSPFCGTHQDAKDPDVMEFAHQWALITQEAPHDVEDYKEVPGFDFGIFPQADDVDEFTIAVCVRCTEVWANGNPAIWVPCPVCEAGRGDRCWNDDSVVGKAAPFPAHPERRRDALETVDDYEPCPENPLQEADDGA